MTRHLTNYRQAGVNSLLDVARQTYKEASADATELVERLAGEKNHSISKTKKKKQLTVSQKPMVSRLISDTIHLGNIISAFKPTAMRYYLRYSLMYTAKGIRSSAKL